MRRIKWFRGQAWLVSPADRDIIERWSPRPEDLAAIPVEKRHRMEIHGLPAPGQEKWEFLAIGDTGDADAWGATIAPQDAVAQELTRDAMAPVGMGNAQFVLHTGDVIYMAGERRLYERNFRRPYRGFLTPESTVDSLVFRLPFLPVPGNHDYYDVGGWASWLTRVPLLGAGLKTMARQFLGFRLPEGGSERGQAFMKAFVATDLIHRPLADSPFPYICGEQTRLPHRYYQWEWGGVDFFALDSNTLDAPPPIVAPESVRQAAKDRKAVLERQAALLDAELNRLQATDAQQQKTVRHVLATDPEQRAILFPLATEVHTHLQQLIVALDEADADPPPADVGSSTSLKEPQTTARNGIKQARDIWENSIHALQAAATGEATDNALRQFDDAGDRICDALSEVQTFLTHLPTGSANRARLITASDAVEQTQSRWSTLVSPDASPVRQRLQTLSQQLLDVQRELALEERRQNYQSSDFDAAQFEWLEAALAQAEKERPNNWRIIFLHHPLYTTIHNHCEGSDVRGLRANLLPQLQATGRVHLILSGHSHTFEWIRSNALPNTGIFVTGGGGQISLRRSVFTPRYAAQSARYRVALQQAGVEECAVAGNGPAANGGETGLLYHYLRVVVHQKKIAVYPVGVRNLAESPAGQSAFRSEEPMPVYHVRQTLPTETQGSADVRLLRCVEIYRDRPPAVFWKE